MSSFRITVQRSGRGTIAQAAATLLLCSANLVRHGGVCCPLELTESIPELRSVLRGSLRGPEKQPPNPLRFPASKPVKADPLLIRGLIDRSNLKAKAPEAVLPPPWIADALLRASECFGAGRAAAPMTVPAGLAAAQEPQMAAPDCGFETSPQRSAAQSRWGAGSSTSRKRPMAGHLDRTHLETAEVVAQVDRKFLLCKLPEVSGDCSTFAFVDQHAADERLRAESFFAELFSAAAPIASLISPIEVIVPSSDLLCEEAALARLRSWGFDCHCSPPPDADGTCRWTQVAVTTVPKLLSDRLAMNASLLQNVVREVLSTTDRAGPAGEGSTGWLARMKTCSRSIFDLVNSKACRGMPSC